MPIITISRGSKSGGEALAEMVAEKLNCPTLISREVLVKVSEDYGVSEKELVATMNEPPHFWSRNTRTKRRLYLTFIRAALLEYAVDGCLVYHGNAGHFLLGEIDWVLKVRLLAPVEQRVAALQRTMNLDKYEALRYIEKVDEERRRWTKFLYNEDWDDPSHFDVVVNLKSTTLETASLMICRLAGSPEFERTDERLIALANKALEARVQAALEADPVTREADIEIFADGTRVTLKGQIAFAKLRERVIETTSRVEGVKQVVAELDVI